MKILIIDDEQLDLFITKKMLSLSFEVTGFQSLDEAVTWSKSNTFDVLVSDYYLGQGIHAPDVLKKIRENVKHTFKSIVLSNHIDDTQAADLKKVGFHAILEKPVTLDKFKAILT